eukprot:COSAG06_NODE_6295_length_2993_cov_7.458880_2_plen_104_part_00
MPLPAFCCSCAWQPGVEKAETFSAILVELRVASLRYKVRYAKGTVLSGRGVGAVLHTSSGSPELGSLVCERIAHRCLAAASDRPGSERAILLHRPPYLRPRAR